MDETTVNLFILLVYASAICIACVCIYVKAFISLVKQTRYEAKEDYRLICEALERDKQECGDPAQADYINPEK